MKERKGILHKSICYFLLAGLLLPLSLYGAQHPSRWKGVIVIDPAHGGADEGVKLTEKIFEKDVTLKVALALQKELQAEGVGPVQLTRTSDSTVKLSERTKMIRTAGSGLLISLHVNAAFGKKAAGYEVYFPGFGAAAPAQKEGAAEIIRDMAGNKHLNASVALAQDILRNMQDVLPREDRRLRDAPVPVLEGLSLPAVVVEMGFATNAEDRKVLMGDNGQKAIAQALAKSVREFVGKGQ